ncbi:putative cytochrome p450 protein [Neofusicoccum parvum UCRNP2]|uniref:Putative cytochrome p450 protein n=1 Tax=Botryosphaeria parva (strain UCR-NP2) TaxID=1287680 RepID=R1EG65_BOTPV|nr:putative cytochrome p450 protein [Neofusicoccum parvum UCRNP2]
MALGLAVYFERKTLLWNSLAVLAASSLVFAKGWIAVPEPVNGLETPIRIVGALVVSIAVLLSTRIWTGVKYQDACSTAGERGPVPVVPSSIPFIGHALYLLWDADSFLRTVRDNVTQNVFGLNFLGTKHVILGSPSVIESIGAKDSEGLDNQTFVSVLRRNILGLSNEVTQGGKAAAVISSDFYDKVFSESNMDSLAKRVVGLLRENVPDLVTFNESFVDQQAWERASLTTVVEVPGAQKDLSESNFGMLIRNFVGHTINTAFAGIAFMDDFPTFNETLQSFESKVNLLATGLPRWVPIPGLPAGYIARRGLLANLNQLQKSYERELGGEDIISTEADVGDFSAAFTTSRRLFNELDVPSTVYAEAHLYAFWALNAAARDLVFWMMMHILAEPGLADRIREEVRLHARVTQPINGFGMMEPPRLDIDLEGLQSKCPLLLSCYMETVRLYNNSWAVQKAGQDVVISDNSSYGVAAKYLVKKGEHVHVSNSLLNTDSQYRSAEKFIADRFVIYSEKQEATRADWGTVRHDNGMWQMAGASKFAQSLCLSTVATVLGVWKMNPVDSGGWKIPRRGEGPLTARPKGDARVRIRRRELERK